jgi:uncharacterized protein
MKIGLLSDTHGYLDPKIFTYFSSCDELWHAGDFGSYELANDLAAFKPMKAVHGNIDDRVLRSEYPEDLWFQCQGLNVWITHIAGTPPAYNPRIRKMFSQKIPDILVCGHSHILRVMKDDRYDLLYLNPGAAGNQGFHHMRTLLRFEIHEGAVRNMEIIELGKRGAIDPSL